MKMTSTLLKSQLSGSHHYRRQINIIQGRIEVKVGTYTYNPFTIEESSKANIGFQYCRICKGIVRSHSLHLCNYLGAVKFMTLFLFQHARVIISWWFFKSLRQQNANRAVSWVQKRTCVHFASNGYVISLTNSDINETNSHFSSTKCRNIWVRHHTSRCQEQYGATKKTFSAKRRYA